MKPEQLKALLPKDPRDWIYYPDAGQDYEGYSGFFMDQAEVDRFLVGLGLDK